MISESEKHRLANVIAAYMAAEMHQVLPADVCEDLVTDILSELQALGYTLTKRKDTAA